MSLCRWALTVLQHWDKMRMRGSSLFSQLWQTQPWCRPRPSTLKLHLNSWSSCSSKGSTMMSLPSQMNRRLFKPNRVKKKQKKKPAQCRTQNHFELIRTATSTYLCIQLVVNKSMIFLAESSARGWLHCLIRWTAFCKFWLLHPLLLAYLIIGAGHVKVHSSKVGLLSNKKDLFLQNSVIKEIKRLISLKIA